MDNYSCLFIRLEYSTAMLAVSMDLAIENVVRTSKPETQCLLQTKIIMLLFLPREFARALWEMCRK